MNNLEMIQEARVGCEPLSDDAIPLDFGPMFCVVYRATGGWFVAIAGDPLHYSFATMAEALDFVCAEARCSQ